MTWHVEYTSAARKELRKMGRVNAARILDWMDKHIDGCEDPRVTGKGLTANRSGQWRYRIGDYRVLCLLRDEVVTVEVFRIRHRSEAYKSSIRRTHPNKSRSFFQTVGLFHARGCPAGGCLRRPEDDYRPLGSTRREPVPGPRKASPCHGGHGSPAGNGPSAIAPGRSRQRNMPRHA